MDNVIFVKKSTNIKKERKIKKNNYNIYKDVQKIKQIIRELSNDIKIY